MVVVPKPDRGSGFVQERGSLLVLIFLAFVLGGASGFWELFSD